MITPEFMMRIGTVVLALVLGIAGACFTFASAFYPPSAAYAIIALVPCAGLVWTLPSAKRA